MQTLVVVQTLAAVELRALAVERREGAVVAAVGPDG